MQHSLNVPIPQLCIFLHSMKWKVMWKIMHHLYTCQNIKYRDGRGLCCSFYGLFTPPPPTIVCIFSLCVHVLIYSNLSSYIASLLLKHIHVLLCMNVCKLRNENLSTCTIIKYFKMIYNNQSFFVNFFISGLHIRAGIFSGSNVINTKNVKFFISRYFWIRIV